MIWFKLILDQLNFHKTLDYLFSFEVKNLMNIYFVKNHLTVQLVDDYLNCISTGWMGDHNS